MVKRYHAKGRMSKAEKSHLESVANMQCIVTGRNDVQIQHITECGRRLGHMYILPLSVKTHAEIYKIPFKEQMELCKEVYRRLNLEWKEPPSKLNEFS